MQVGKGYMKCETIYTNFLSKKTIHYIVYLLYRYVNNIFKTKELNTKCRMVIMLTKKNCHNLKVESVLFGRDV